MTFNSFHNAAHLYFVTASICGWKHLFIEPAYAEIALGSLAWLRRENRMNLYAFVLMPSHLHMIVKPSGRTIGELLQEFGSYTAHEVLKQLQADNQSDLLQFFHQQINDRRHKHRLWQDIQAKNIYSRKFLIQKMEYIHNNPVGKQWRLVADRADYQYSSACYYDRGITPVIEVDDVRVWL